MKHSGSPRSPQRPIAAVLGALVARVLGVMAEQGVPLVELEGHLTDAHIDVLTGIPVVGADPMTVFVTA